MILFSFYNTVKSKIDRCLKATYCNSFKRPCHHGNQHVKKNQTHGPVVDSKHEVAQPLCKALLVLVIQTYITFFSHPE